MARWTDMLGTEHQALWIADDTRPPPQGIVTADDRLPANTALRLAQAGTALLWTGDYHNARHLLQALDRRLVGTHTPSRRTGRKAVGEHPLTAAFWQQREQQALRAQILGMVLVNMSPEHHLNLRRAPEVSQACLEALGPVSGPYVMPLRQLLGFVGAHEWRKAGIPVHALQDRRVHAHYGVFAPVRGEYLDLVARAPLPIDCRQAGGLAWDIGTGTGVLAAILHQRGVPNVIGTDLSERSVACAQDNIHRLGMTDAVQIRRVHMFPEGQADLIVCNPPWLPGQPASILEQAVYDPGSCMLREYLHGLRSHLRPRGEGWLILSDLAERLHLRDPEWLVDEIAAAGLRVIDRLDTSPIHRRSRDTRDPVHAARSAEITSLWRLGIAAS